MCKGLKPVAEVKCYVYHEADRYDLSPLATTNGGYLVSSEGDTNVYINVCRDIGQSKYNQLSLPELLIPFSA